MENILKPHGSLYEIRIGLIGHNYITTAQAQHIRHTLKTAVLPNLQAKYPYHRISLLTPLAPGSDYLLAREMTGWFAAHHTPCALHVVQTLPPDTLVEEYQPAWAKGGSWDGEGTATGDWDTQKHTILQTLETLIQQSADHSHIISLPPPDGTPALPRNQPAFQQAARWIVDQADELVAVCDPNRASGGPGGTLETLGWWQIKDPGSLHLSVIDPGAA